MKNDAPPSTTVCVTNADSLIGTMLVIMLLERDYTVRATVRDPGNNKKVKHLLDLPKADTNLTLWKADLNEEGSFDEAIAGCAGVFHVATPMDFESKDPENEVIKPTINGVLGIIRSCSKAKTVKRLVFTSSAGTVNVHGKQQLSVYDETNWSDLDFVYSKKMTGWMYFVSKTLAEEAAWEAAKESNINFISIIPPLVVGPFIMPTFPPSLITAFSPITGNQAHYSIIKQGQFVHLDDLCEAHIFLYENPEAEGRYICSPYDATIYDLAKMMREKWPEYNVPSEFEGIDKNLPSVTLSSDKLTGMGFKFKYRLEDKKAIDTCGGEGLLHASVALNTLQISAMLAGRESQADDSWYLDSGAANHVTADLNNLFIHREYTGPTKVIVGNGARLPITHVGSSIFQTNYASLYLYEILCVPQISKNLLSVSQLTKDNNIFIQFSADSCVIKNSQGLPLRHGYLENGLYKV